MDDDNQAGDVPSAPREPVSQGAVDVHEHGYERVEVEFPKSCTGRAADAWLLGDFAGAIGSVCSRNGVFLLDGVPVVLQPHADRMEDLDADCFRTYVEKNLVCYKMVRVGKNSDGSPQWDRGYESMNKMQAAGVLRAHEFRKKQRPLRLISSVPLPLLRAGELVIHSEGYDQESQILVREK